VSNNFNSVVTAGKDAVVRTTPSGQSVLSVPCASNVGFGDKQTTLWITVNLWRNNVENLAQYIKKGSQLYISGQLSQREYQAQDGTTRTNLELNANILDLVGKRDSNAQPSQASQPAPQQNQPEYSNFDDPDIPF
jgi:single-strand DNA-binding protein